MTDAVNDPPEPGTKSADGQFVVDYDISRDRSVSWVIASDYFRDPEHALVQELWSDWFGTDPIGYVLVTIECNEPIRSVGTHHLKLRLEVDSQPVKSAAPKGWDVVEA